MGRSVSVPGDAYCTAYVDLTAHAGEPGEGFDWELFIEDLQDVISHRYPSFGPLHRWAGRETEVILENSNGCIAVCEYCGLVSVSLVVRNNPLARKWAASIEDNLLDLINSTFGGLRKIGTASNGEAFFQRIA